MSERSAVAGPSPIQFKYWVSHGSRYTSPSRDVGERARVALEVGESKRKKEGIRSGREAPE